MARLRFTLLTAATVIALAALALNSPAQQQPPGGNGRNGGGWGGFGKGGPGGFGGGFGGPGGGSLLGLAANPVIQVELKATDKQKAQIKSLSDKVDSQTRALRAQMGFGGGPGGGPNGPGGGQNGQNAGGRQNRNANGAGQAPGGFNGGGAGTGGNLGPNQQVDGGFVPDQQSGDLVQNQSPYVGGGFGPFQQGGGFVQNQSPYGGGGFGPFQQGGGLAQNQNQQQGGGFGQNQNQQGGRGNRGNRGGPIDPERAQQFALLRENMNELRDSGDQNLARILNKGQYARLEQVQLQLAGPGVIFRPEVIETLNINEDQLAMLQELRGEQRQAQNEIRKTQRQFFQTQFRNLNPGQDGQNGQNGQNGGNGGNQANAGNGPQRKNRGRFDPEAMKKAMDNPQFQAQMEENRVQQKKLEDSYAVAINKVLYPRQRTILKKLLGAPFDRSKLGGRWAGPGNRANQAAAKTGNGPTSSSDDDEEGSAASAKPATKKAPAKAKPAATNRRKSLRELRGSSSSSDQ